MRLSTTSETPVRVGSAVVGGAIGGFIGSQYDLYAAAILIVLGAAAGSAIPEGVRYFRKKN